MLQSAIEVPRKRIVVLEMNQKKKKKKKKEEEREKKRRVYMNYITLRRIAKEV